MTVTPRIIRNLEVPGKEFQAFWSGTEENYSTKQIFAGIPTSVDTKEGETAAQSAPGAVPPPKQLPAPLKPVTPPAATQQPSTAEELKASGDSFPKAI